MDNDRHACYRISPEQFFIYLFQKIANALKPTSQWKPVNKEYEAVCKENNVTNMNALEKIKLNLLGETNI